MSEIKDKVAELMAMLDGFHEEAKNVSGAIDRVTSWFDQEPKKLITENLDLILSKVKGDAPKETFQPHLVLLSPEGRVSPLGAHQGRPEGYLVLNIFQLSRFVQSLKSEVEKGNWMSAVEFIKANREASVLPVYTAAHVDHSETVVTQRPDEARWKPSDFLPMLPPYPPLPRGLFKNKE